MYKIANLFFTSFNNTMEIQKINNSPSFQAIQLSAKEGRKVANIIRKYKKEPRPEIKEQLLDVFEPHIKKRS